MLPKISVSFFVNYFPEFLKLFASGFSMIFATGIRVSHFLCAQGVGDLHIKKIVQGLTRGKMVRLGID